MECMSITLFQGGSLINSSGVCLVYSALDSVESSRDPHQFSSLLAKGTVDATDAF